MRLSKNDQELIGEAYEQMNEGMFDRFKARGSQALGAVKGAGQQIAGKAQQAVGGAIGKAAGLGGQVLGVDASKGDLAQKGSAMQKAGAKQQTAGARQGDEAKYKSYITNSAKTIAKDLTKLGMSVSDEATLIADIQAAITKNLTQVTASGQFRDTGGRIGKKVV
jgi:hypothetical protein